MCFQQQQQAPVHTPPQPPQPPEPPPPRPVTLPSAELQPLGVPSADGQPLGIPSGDGPYLEDISADTARRTVELRIALWDDVLGRLPPGLPPAIAR